jgi:hypothetical protein
MVSKFTGFRRTESRLPVLWRAKLGETQEYRENLKV